MYIGMTLYVWVHAPYWRRTYQDMTTKRARWANMLQTHKELVYECTKRTHNPPMLVELDIQSSMWEKVRSKSTYLTKLLGEEGRGWCIIAACGSIINWTVGRCFDIIEDRAGSWGSVTAGAGISSVVRMEGLVQGWLLCSRIVGIKNITRLNRTTGRRWDLVDKVGRLKLVWGWNERQVGGWLVDMGGRLKEYCSVNNVVIRPWRFLFVVPIQVWHQSPPHPQLYFPDRE